VRKLISQIHQVESSVDESNSYTSDILLGDDDLYDPANLKGGFKKQKGETKAQVLRREANHAML
jgi:hypothetical protein